MWTARMNRALVEQLLAGGTVHLMATRGILVLGLDDERALNIEYIPEEEIQSKLWPSGTKPSQ